MDVNDCLLIVRWDHDGMHCLELLTLWLDCKCRLFALKLLVQLLHQVRWLRAVYFNSNSYLASVSNAKFRHTAIHISIVDICLYSTDIKQIIIWTDCHNENVCGGNSIRIIDAI
jgi:hypothetical protein